MPKIPLNSNSLTELKVEQARKLAKKPGPIMLNGLKVLSEEAAAALDPPTHQQDPDAEGSILFLDGLLELDESTAAALAKHAWRISLNGLKSLSEQTAKKLVENGLVLLSLNGLTSVMESVAELLNGTQALYLDGLTTISERTAKALGSAEWLSLNGLQSLSSTAALLLSGKDSLGSCTRCLNGIQSLTEETAEAIAVCNGDVFLNGLTQLPENVAKALAEHPVLDTNFPKILSLDGVTELSDAAAQAIANHKGQILFLNGVASLSEQAADALMEYKGYLGLNGLAENSRCREQYETLRPKGYLPRITKDFAEHLVSAGSGRCDFPFIDDDAASALAQFDGNLSLSLTSLSDVAATALAMHKGNYLSLDGLTSLSESAAKALINHEGTLALGRLTTLSDAVAAALAQHKGELNLYRLNSISDSPGHLALARKLTERFPGMDGQRSLTTLSDSAAAVLAQCEYCLCLDGLSTLSETAAAALARHKSPLRLNGLARLSDSAAAALSQHEGGLELTKLTCLSNSPGHLALARTLIREQYELRLDGITLLSDEAAAILAEYDKSISLRCLTQLTDGPGHLALAAKLSREDVSLYGLTALSDAAAETLAQGENTALSLMGLTTLSDSVATALAKHKGELCLGLTDLSDTVAAALAQHNGHLELDKVTTLSDASAAALSKHNGTVYLHGLIELSGTPGHIAISQKIGRQKYESGTTEQFALQSISPEAADGFFGRLGRQKTIWLRNISQISDEMALIISKARFFVALDNLKQISGSPGHVALAKRLASDGEVRLDKLTDLSVKAAAALSDTKELLSLDGIANLSDELAARLSRHRGDCLRLNGISTLSENAAAALAKHTGTLFLNGLTSLSEAATAEIATHHGDLYLDSLKTLSLSQAWMLSQHTGGLLSLNGLLLLTFDVAEALGRHHGPLLLNGVRCLSYAAAETTIANGSYEVPDGETRVQMCGMATVSDDVALCLYVEYPVLLNPDFLTQESFDYIRLCSGFYGELIKTMNQKAADDENGGEHDDDDDDDVDDDDDDDDFDDDSDDDD